MAISSAQSRDNEPNAISALEASLTGVVAMSVFAYLVAPSLGLPVVDLALFGAATIVAPGGGDLLFALFRLWPVGVAAGFVYAFLVVPHVPWAHRFRGALYGLALFLLLSVIAMPLAGPLHPNVTGGRILQPGWLGLVPGGWLVPVVLLGDHLVFGILLGAIYRPGPRAVEMGDGRG